MNTESPITCIHGISCDVRDLLQSLCAFHLWLGYLSCCQCNCQSPAVWTAVCSCVSGKPPKFYSTRKCNRPYSGLQIIHTPQMYMQHTLVCANVCCLYCATYDADATCTPFCVSGKWPTNDTVRRPARESMATAMYVWAARLSASRMCNNQTSYSWFKVSDEYPVSRNNEAWLS